MPTRIPYFRPTVPNTGAVPAAGSIPTALPSVSSGLPVKSTFHNVVAPLPRTRLAVNGSVSLPGSVPTVLDDLQSSGTLASMASGHVSATPVDAAAPVVVVEAAENPANRATPLVIEGEPPEAPGAVHYPREPIRRHRHNRDQKW